MPAMNRRYFESLMRIKKLSLRALAAKMGMGHSQLSLTFSGARRLQLEEAAQLSQIFGEPLNKIIENAGIATRPVAGNRVSVVGAVQGDGAITPTPAGAIERVTAPEDVPDHAIALQCRTAGTPLAWADRWLLFCRKPDGVDLAILGRLAYCKIKDGPAVVATVTRGYRDDSHNLAGFYNCENAILDFATPILLIRP